MTAPAKGARTQNKFDQLADTKPEEAKAEKAEAPKERPKFTGSLKGLLSKQNEDNAEANKGNSDFQKKLVDTIVIHEAKPPRKEGEGVAHGEEQKRTFGGKPHHRASEEQEVEDDGFEQVQEEGRKRGEQRTRGTRGTGRGGRGGFRGSDDHHHHEGERPQARSQPAATATETSAPKKEVKTTTTTVPAGAANFSGWGGANLF